jgi:AraC family transcriptional regulator
MPPSLAKILRQEWDGITVEYGRLDEIGEFDFPMPQNIISVAFLPHEQVTWSVDGKTQQTHLPAGSVFLYGDRQFTWHQRHKPSEYLNLILDPDLLKAIATDHNLPPTLQHRIIFQDPTILHIAQLLKTEILNGGIAGTLYVESLRNLLAVHLLRHHTLLTPALPTTTLDPLKIKSEVRCAAIASPSTLM